MRSLLAEEEFAGLFDAFRDTAFRLETRDRYNVDVERVPFQRFLAGEPADDAWIAGFCAQVRAWSKVGKRMSRVRVVSVPHSDYVRWSLTVARLNSQAGEDIRYLPRERAEKLELPAEDFWLFDSRRVAVLRFDDADRLLGAELIDDPDEVARRCRWRDVAWQHAIAWSEYNRL